MRMKMKMTALCSCELHPARSTSTRAQLTGRAEAVVFIFTA